MTYPTATWKSKRELEYNPDFNSRKKPMSKPVVFVLAGTMLTFISVASNPVLAITHGCTPPTGVPDYLTIDMNLDGKNARASGGYCEVIGKAEAAIAKSRLPRKGKQTALEQLKKLQVQVASSGRAAGKRKPKWNIKIKCTANTTKQGCSGSVGVTF